MPTQEERLAGAEILLENTIEVLTRMVQDGLIEKDAVDPYVQAAHRAILDMRSSVVLEKDGFSEAWGAFSAAMESIEEVRK
jgi:hypothetical protein